MRGAAKLICASFLHMHNEQVFVTVFAAPGAGRVITGVSAFAFSRRYGEYFISVCNIQGCPRNVGFLAIFCWMDNIPRGLGSWLQMSGA